jgi:hypothetical protein
MRRTLTAALSAVLLLGCGASEARESRSTAAVPDPTAASATSSSTTVAPIATTATTPDTVWQPVVSCVADYDLTPDAALLGIRWNPGRPR